MATHKYIDRICLVAALLSLLAAMLLFSQGASQDGGTTLGYEARLFDTGRVHTIDIVMDDWEGFLETCENEEYASCAVVIDGEAYKNIGIRAKGNTSLSMVSSLDSDRYSFKLEFDQYETGRSYYGLDKLCLNNLIQDNTMMKDYLVYQMMNANGVDAPLCSYVYITVNGQDWGLYLAVEGVEEGFLQRTGNSRGELYKPDSLSMGGGRGNGRDFNMDDLDLEGLQNQDGESRTTAPENPGSIPEQSGIPGSRPEDEAGTPEQSGIPANRPEGEAGVSGQSGIPANSPEDEASTPEQSGIPTNPPEDEAGATESEPDSTAQPGGGRPERPDFGGERQGGPGGMGGMGASDVKLQYIDDDPDSYANIFDSAKTDVSDADKARLIAALKALGENDTSALDVDQVLRYFAVHNYVCNGDSYTGNLVHNYYLYEEEGRLAMIPWDYNLAFGGFQTGNASAAVNDPIDTPQSVTGSGDRPMIDWIFSDAAYTEQYHQYFAEFLETVDPASLIAEAAALIAPYVEKDPTKFCTYEEFETAVQVLTEFCKLRTESVAGQLAGEIPATSEGQAAEPSALVDTAGLNLSDMGNMNNGGGFRGGAGGFGGNRGQKNGNGFGQGAALPPDGAMNEANALSPDGASNETGTLPSDGSMGETNALPPDGASKDSGTPSTDGASSQAGAHPSGGNPGQPEAVPANGGAGSWADGAPTGQGWPSAEGSPAAMAFPGGPPEIPGSSGGAASVGTETIVLLAGSVVVLLAGVLLLKRYRRWGV